MDELNRSSSHSPSATSLGRALTCADVADEVSPILQLWAATSSAVRRVVPELIDDGAPKLACSPCLTRLDVSDHTISPPATPPRDRPDPLARATDADVATSVGGLRADWIKLIQSEPRLADPDDPDNFYLFNHVASVPSQGPDRDPSALAGKAVVSYKKLNGAGTSCAEPLDAGDDGLEPLDWEAIMETPTYWPDTWCTRSRSTRKSGKRFVGQGAVVWLRPAARGREHNRLPTPYEWEEELVDGEFVWDEY